MEKKAEHIVQNIGAIAETTSIFYNTIIKQVPRDVALILTQHFMDITIARRPVSGNTAAAAAQAAARAAEERRRAAQQNREGAAHAPEHTETQTNTEESDSAGGKMSQEDGTEQ